ncbi:MAG: 50S ribosomal protein L21 [bacterium]|nr:50S ribosomal protein L21 [bacterium]
MAKHAVIATGGKQYLVAEGQIFNVEKLLVEAKSTLTLDKVLLVLDGETVKVGKPSVTGAKVALEVLEHGLGKKLYVETYKAKTRKHRKIGHRQPFTRVKVAKITG